MVGRFAPSPTGPLHLGSLRTALAAWLFARAAGSRFLVRIEDLDPQRSRREWEQDQLGDLRALGIDWDGTPVRQSERFALYEAALAELDRLPAGCTRASAPAPRSAPPPRRRTATCPRAPTRAHAGRSRPPSGGRGWPPASATRSGSTPARSGSPTRTRCSGRRARVVDDFVVRRADGVPAYQLAVVVDDADQRIEQVVRGADLADSTGRQILLARWLGLPVPAYAHVGLVLGADGARLAKRHGAATLADRRSRWRRRSRCSPTRSAWRASRDRVDSAAELLDEFDPGELPRGPVTFGTP